MPEKVLISGGSGFIASFVIDRILKTTNWQIVLVCKSESKYGKIRLADVNAANNPRVRFIRADISSGVPNVSCVDYILHMGAESHVDVSISEPEKHIRSNVIGTYKMLEYARTLPNLKKFLMFSTDEVYGSAKPGETFTEWSRYNSGNPYAATKAAAEELSLAWENTYKVPVVITHSMNVFGERQQPTSVIPRFIKKILDGEKTSGVTIMLVDTQMDHGPKLRNIQFLISNDETFESLEKKMAEVGSKLLLETIPGFLNGSIKPQEQDHELATYTKMISKEDGYFDIETPPSSEKLDRMIRAFYPWPNVWTRWMGKVVKFYPENKMQIEGKNIVSKEEFLRGYPDFPIK